MMLVITPCLYGKIVLKKLCPAKVHKNHLKIIRLILSNKLLMQPVELRTLFAFTANITLPTI